MTATDTGRPAQAQVPAGLRGVVVAETSIGDVRGEEGFYHYRQYAATDLAAQCSLEEIWHLMVIGHLPSPSELSSFEEALVRARAVPAEVLTALPAIVAASHGASALEGLRSALSVTGSALRLRPLYDIDEAQRLDDGLRLAAVVPTLAAAMHRLAQGLDVVEPRSDLGHVANYLYMLTGSLPAQGAVDALQAYISLTVDHGFNASTFAARVVASTGADTAACLVSGLSGLSGPLHGGAPSRVLDTLDEIGRPEHADAWVREQLGSGGRVMGFGHAVYRTDDPRSTMLEAVARRSGGELFALAEQVEKSVVTVLNELKPGRRLYTNVEYYAAVVMSQCGLDRSLFTPTFAVGRVIGWSANVLEQATEGRIVRPSASYVGAPAPQPVPTPSARA